MHLADTLGYGLRALHNSNRNAERVKKDITGKTKKQECSACFWTVVCPMHVNDTPTLDASLPMIIFLLHVDSILKGGGDPVLFLPSAAPLA